MALGWHLVERRHALLQVLQALTSLIVNGDLVDHRGVVDWLVLVGVLDLDVRGALIAMLIHVQAWPTQCRCARHTWLAAARGWAYHGRLGEETVLVAEVTVTPTIPGGGADCGLGAARSLAHRREVDNCAVARGRSGA